MKSTKWKNNIGDFFPDIIDDDIITVDDPEERLKSLGNISTGEYLQLKIKARCFIFSRIKPLLTLNLKPILVLTFIKRNLFEYLFEPNNPNSAV